MRSILKVGNGGRHLEKSNDSPPTTREEATSRWSSFRKHKSMLSLCLNYEQYGLCAYSEIRPDRVGLGTHIEHIEPKSQNPSRTFDYRNLILSALSSEDMKSRSKDDVFGGHAKLSVYDSSLFVSCLNPICSQHFVYLLDGRVEPSIKLDQGAQDSAQYTIDLLNLNSPYLVTLRKNWLNELDILIDEHINNNASLEYLAAVDLLPHGEKLSEFFSATRQRFGHVAETILREENESRLQ